MLSNNYTALLHKYTYLYTCSTIKGGMVPLLTHGNVGTQNFSCGIGFA